MKAERWVPMALRAGGSILVLVLLAVFLSFVAAGDARGAVVTLVVVGVLIWAVAES